MRIISGRYRSLKLNQFPGSDIRPTGDRVKESLFNILAPSVPGARVLDLFCGSGALGIECISRGADFVDFNDVSPASIRLLRSNLAKLKNERAYAVTTGDYALFLRGAKTPFDIIFIDPPYADDSGICALKLIAGLNLLTPSGVAVYERDRAFRGEVEGLKVTDERKYGRTYLTFFTPDRGLST